MDASPAVDDCCVKLTSQKGGVSSRRLSHSACSSRGVNSGFKSPVQKSNAGDSKMHPEEETRELRQTLHQLDCDITLLEKDGFVEEELDKHVDLLHEYNDIKDTAQTLLGRLASLRGVTTRDLYNDFGLELDD